MRNTAHEILRWLVRTPGQTFDLYPLAVVAFELTLHHGEIISCHGGVCCLFGAICSTFWSATIACRVPAAVGAWKHLQTGSSQAALIGTHATRCISAMSFSWRGSRSLSGRGSRSSCSPFAPYGFTVACCVTSSALKRASASSTPPTEARSIDGYPVFFKLTLLPMNIRLPDVCSWPRLCEKTEPRPKAAGQPGLLSR